jgi:DNA-binding HxlR family transcriptional regulator
VRSAPVPIDACGMARAADLLGDRWSLLILREAFYGVARFDDMRADIGAPRALLSQRLDRLVAAGVLERRPYREPGARVRQGYHLTPAGQELAIPLLAMMQWGDRHLRDDAPPWRLIERGSGAPLEVGLLSPDGRAVPLADAVPDFGTGR